MDNREAQQRGAADKAAGRECADQALILAGVDIEAVVMYAHGWMQGHPACTCQVLMGARDINAPVNMASDDAAR